MKTFTRNEEGIVCSLTLYENFKVTNFNSSKKILKIKKTLNCYEKLL